MHTLPPAVRRVDCKAYQEGAVHIMDAFGALIPIGVLIIVEAILYSSIRQAARSADNGVLWRTIGSFACLVLEQIGAVILFSGNAAGLYLVGLGMMSSFIFMVTGAWLLLVGVSAQQASTAESAS